VAHDIASPTGVIVTVLDELDRDCKRPELVTMARRGLRRLLRLSEQLALAAELEAGAVAPDRSQEDIRSLTKDALEHAIAIDGRRDIVTSCDVPPTKLVANVDRRLVISVLREVIGNALRLTSSRVVVTVLEESGRAIVRVEDDGSGFSNDVLATVGQRFTPRSCVRGLGLSLSMAKDILAAHGGELRIETSALPPGRRGLRGAAVIVNVPLLPSPA
jgi:signal transduction histidine kinase